MFVSANLFPECSITSQSYCKMDYVTNGVYHKRWIHEEIQELLNEYLPGWDENPILLGQVYNVPSELLLKAHIEVKSELVNLVNKLTDASFSDDVLTIGIARRITAYKRNNLILQDLERLKSIAEYKGELQILFAGVVKRSKKTLRSLWHQRYEGGHERSFELQHLGWVVAGGWH
jgi:starch phosphorylase